MKWRRKPSMLDEVVAEGRRQVTVIDFQEFARKIQVARTPAEVQEAVDAYEQRKADRGW